MDRDRLLETLHDESTGLLAAARSADPQAPVPGCPDWTTAELVWHIGEVHDFWGWIVRERATVPDAYDDPERPGAGLPTDEAFAAVCTFASERAAELHRVLTDTDPATTVWSWSTQHDVAWVIRRMAHETAVHRVDAEHAAGREHRLEPGLAADGIDEFLEFFLPSAAVDRPALAGSVHLHCTDADGEWTVHPDGAGGNAVTRDHAKADAALRGDAHDLLMVLWRRVPLDAITVFGDAELAARFVNDTTSTD
jgi:uncharacterized protein (TIGR03083 family)